MKRTALLVTAALVAVTPLAANAAPAKATKRTITATYAGALGASTPAASFNSNCSGGVGDCMEFSTVKGEKTVTITAVDGSGTPVGLQVFTDEDFQTVATYCGKATIAVSPKSATAVSVRPALASDCKALPTQGTITAVITTR